MKKLLIIAVVLLSSCNTLKFQFGEDSFARKNVERLLDQIAMFMRYDDDTAYWLAEQRNDKEWLKNWETGRCRPYLNHNRLTSDYEVVGVCADYAIAFAIEWNASYRDFGNAYYVTDNGSKYFPRMWDIENLEEALRKSLTIDFHDDWHHFARYWLENLNIVKNYFADTVLNKVYETTYESNGHKYTMAIGYSKIQNKYCIFESCGKSEYPPLRRTQDHAWVVIESADYAILVEPTWYDGSFARQTNVP